MDYSYYSINQVPLVTYGMIAITTGVLVFVSLSDNDESSNSAGESNQSTDSSESGEQSEQIGGRHRTKKRSKQRHFKNRNSITKKYK